MSTDSIACGAGNFRDHNPHLPCPSEPTLEERKATDLLGHAEQIEQAVTHLEIALLKLEGIARKTRPETIGGPVDLSELWADDAENRAYTFGQMTAAVAHLSSTCARYRAQAKRLRDAAAQSLIFPSLYF